VDLPPPPDCAGYVPDELKQDTPHATPPFAPEVAHVTGADVRGLDILKGWENFGIAEAGQLNKANSDRRAERHILTFCEAKYREALDRAAHRLKPWYKRIF
jgi:hypothetical protein